MLRCQRGFNLKTVIARFLLRYYIYGKIEDCPWETILGGIVMAITVLEGRSVSSLETIVVDGDEAITVDLKGVFLLCRRAGQFFRVVGELTPSQVLHRYDGKD